MLEAVDNPPVFARSFPNYNVENFALYKVKSPSIGCGAFSEATLAAAQAQVDDDSKPPYLFQRGEHITPIPVLLDNNACLGSIFAFIDSVEVDVATAWLRAGANRCGPMLVDEGIIDRDLGTSNWDEIMEDFIDDHLAASVCDEGCANSNLAEEVDVENFLKNFAMYAVMTNTDSPLGNGNNYYLANAGDGTGWKIVPWDHNARGDPVCNFPVCDSKIIYWSITRPTCRSLESNQLVGPLLSNPVYFEQYLGYVREFVDTIVTNSSFIEELSNHAAAIQADQATDRFSFNGMFYGEELSEDASVWNSPSGVIPLLPTLKARAAEIRAQLESLEANTITEADNADPSDTCLDWREQQTNDACPAGQTEVLVDFSEFEGRQYITEIPGILAVTAIGDDTQRSYTPGGAARVYDTSRKNFRDRDLGSPNETCNPPGLGRGAGGKRGKLGENCVPQGNVLVIQESNIKKVDDSSAGGAIRFDFEASKQYSLLNVGLLDIDDGTLNRIVSKDRTGVYITTMSKGLGNNAFQEIKVDQGHEEALSSVIVLFTGSGSVSYLTLCETTA